MLLGEASPPTVVVFEIDGDMWRPSNEYGMMGWNGMPVWAEQHDTLSVAGRVLVDTTYFYHHYFIDVNADNKPEYQLGFGPSWYVPASGATRPGDGDFVTVGGWLHERQGIDMLVVEQLNGLAWRSASAAAPWAGTWMHAGHADTTFAYCVNDSLSWMAFPPGHMGHMMHGGRWPDSTFVQFWEVHPDSLPSHQGFEFVSGYFVDIQNPSGETMMNGSFGRAHGMMSFNKPHLIRFHYHHDDLVDYELSEDGLDLWHWDDDAEMWVRLETANHIQSMELIEVSDADLHGHYAIGVRSVITSVENPKPSELQANQFDLTAYPNPFKTGTTISFDLPQDSNVDLSIYDLSGRRIKTLLYAYRAAGEHSVVFYPDQLPAGVYVFQIQTRERVQAKIVTLVN
jgi:hypothetical protein